MRVAVTILYNGLHHLKHNDFAEFMANNFDYWAVVDGLSMNSGSTAWCNKLDLPANSTDGSIEFMQDITKRYNTILFSHKLAPYKSKDHQVNAAVDLLRTKTKHGWLWQVDVDEQWTAEKLADAEQRLFFDNAREGAFQFNHFVGKDIIAEGGWGSGFLPRLFKWRGQRFISHEPPRMDVNRRIKNIEGIKFNHYSYCFEQDVLFKEKYYGGYKGIHANWLKLQQANEFPQPLSALLPPTTWHYQFNENTKIVKYNDNQSL